MGRGRIWSVAVALAVVALVGAGCGDDDDGGSGNGGGGESAGGEKKVIAASLYSRDVPYYQAIGDGLKEQAEEYGWVLKLVYSKPDPSAQIDAIDTLLTQQPDGLVMVPIDANGLIPAANSAQQQDVPVVALGDELADRSAQTAYVGGDFVQYGRDKADWIAKELGGKGTVGVIHGIRGITFTEDQFEGAKEAFAEHPGIKVVDGPYAGGFSADLGLTAAQNLLTANPDLDAIYFDNDDLALGGIRAARDRDIAPEDILIVGTDGLTAGKEAVKAGDLDYTLDQCAVDQGREAIRTLKKVFDDEEVPEEIITKTVGLTPDNIAEAESACGT
jgi:ABC-type sugar transport system substrate-binding protein